MNNQHIPFLKQVASYYASTPGLKDYCFVFPNRRSGQFFSMFLEKLQDHSESNILHPCITTISDFVAELANEVTPNSVQSLFLLYKAYTVLPGNEDYPFDKFVYWGNVVLSDFNDVDMYLVNAKDIFNNIKEYREISTDFLPKELKQDLSRYLNFHEDKCDDDRFWKNLESSDGADGEVKKSYLRLWQQLLPLYEEFNKELNEAGLSYTGKTYRDAAQTLVNNGTQMLRHKRYAFIGFNVLSNCEMSIFSKLKKAGIADFFWDNKWPAMEDRNNLATKFVSLYAKHFPEPADFAPDALAADEWPDIQTMAIPSNYGQVKCAFRIVQKLVKANATKAENAINTAIVLPDESLFTPLINSVTSDIKNINVTLGYPLKSADIVSLMHTVAQMHRQASWNGNEWRFYREDVRNVLSHPIIKSAFAQDALVVAQIIDNNNDYNITENLIPKQNSIKPLFNTISSNCSKEMVLAYMDTLIEFVQGISQSISSSVTSKSEGEGENDLVPLQCEFIEQFVLIMQQIKYCINSYGVPQCESTIFYLTDRLTSTFTIPFEGEPLNGLQVMGVLETRCLDFDNVIMLSMNERIFPHKHNSRSFIADNVRRFYHIASAEHKESMTSYYFYRLLARAKRVFLLYSTQQGSASSEPSRYIAQLKKIYNLPITSIVVNSKLLPSYDYSLNLPKDEYSMKLINSYRSDDSEKGYLSASSINEYINCSLKFALHHIYKLNDETDKGQFMDAATQGTIVHDSLQELYYPEGTIGHFKVTTEMIKSFRNRLEAVVTRQINKTYLHLPDDLLDAELIGDSKIQLVAIRLLIEQVLNYDLKLLSNKGEDFFEVLECESPHQVRLQAGDIEFKFEFRADRIDRIGGKGPIRIVDYKTGSDVTEFTSIETLFNETATRPKQILQLILYCLAYEKDNPECEEDIMPVIYKLRKMEESGIYYKDKIKKQKYQITLGLLKQEKLLDDFCMSLGNRLKDLFSGDNQFKQCPEKTNHCNYCRFISLCKRQIKELNY